MLIARVSSSCCKSLPSSVLASDAMQTGVCEDKIDTSRMSMVKKEKYLRAPRSNYLFWRQLLPLKITVEHRAVMPVSNTNCHSILESSSLCLCIRLWCIVWWCDGWVEQMDTVQVGESSFCSLWNQGGDGRLFALPGLTTLQRFRVINKRTKHKSTLWLDSSVYLPMSFETWETHMT